MEQIIGKEIVHLKVTDSTNNYANHKLRLQSVPEGTVFWHMNNLPDVAKRTISGKVMQAKT